MRPSALAIALGLLLLAPRAFAQAPAVPLPPTDAVRAAVSQEAAPNPGAAADPAAAPAKPEAAAPGAQGGAAATPPPADEAALRAMIAQEATKVGLPSEVAEAVAEVESGFDPKAVGAVGEIGLMQVMPSTARMLGFRDPLPALFEPETNVRYGVRYLGEAWKMTNQDICATVMKYRAGHGETRYSQRSVDYCLRVRALLAARGFKVTGAVPAATFGAPAPVGVRMAVGKARIGRRLPNGRMRVVFNWRPIDVKRRSLDKLGAASLKIVE